MIDPTMITGAAVGAVTYKAVDHAHAQLKEALQGPHVGIDERILGCLERIEDHFIAQQLAAQQASRSVVLTPGYQTDYLAGDYPYNMIFTPSGCDVIFSIPALGNITATLYPGWNDINLPVGTLIGLATNASATVTLIVREANDTIASSPQFSGQAQAGYDALVSPPTQTNAGSDTLLTFAGPTSSITIQNKSAAPAYFAFDQAASPGSLEIDPGVTVVYTKKAAALHIYTAAAVNINGATTPNIVVTGEL